MPLSPRPLLVIALLTLGPGAAWAQQSPAPSPSPGEVPMFPAEIDRVMVDVVVQAGNGHPLSTLGRDDFSLLEDGVPQTLESFEVVRVPEAAPAAAAPPPQVSTNAGRESQLERTFAVVFDDLHLEALAAPRAKAAVAQFLKTAVRPGDRVILVATSGDAWWSATMPSGRDELMGLLKRLEGRWVPDNAPDRITPWEAMRIYLYHDPLVVAQVTERWRTYGTLQPQSGAQGGTNPTTPYEDPQVLARAANVYLQDVTRSRTTLALIERVLTSMAVASGRKSLVLMSEGFVYDPNQEGFRRTLEASRRSNTALYFVDARGLEGMPLSDTAEFGPALDPGQFTNALLDQPKAEGAEKLAGDSGGFSVKNSNDLAKGLARISAESEAYYLLGYRSTNRARDGRFRKIEVKVRRKGVDVRARKGYFAPVEGGRAVADNGAPKGDPVLQQAIDSAVDQVGIPLRASAFVFDQTLKGLTKVVAAAELDIRKLAFQDQDGRLVDDLEVLFALSHRETGASLRKDENIAMKLLPDAREKMARDWYTLVKDFDLAPGRYRLRVIVRDHNSGHLASVTHEFDVPDLDRLRASTPLLSDVLQGSGGGQHPVLQLRRSYRPDAMLYCEFQVYGAAKDKAGTPRVSAGYEIRRSDGSVLARVEPNPMRPTSLGALSRLFAAPLEGAEPGPYELVVAVKDALAGSALELREPIVVEAPHQP